MKSSDPLVSVIISVYNGKKYILRALLSILAQSFDNFEIILIDDGSTDGTANAIKLIQDQRVKFIQQENQGLTKSLNRALRMANGKWIARHDADDFSIYSRFEKQIEFLRSNPDLGMVGTSCFIQPERHGIINEVYIYPQAYNEILDAFYHYNPLVHGSVIINKDIMDEVGGYNEEFLFVQDYELWSRIIKRTKVSNLSVPLYVRTVHRHCSQITANKEPIFNKIQKRFIEYYPEYKIKRRTKIKEIQAVDIYPLLKATNGWNKLLRQTFRRIGVEAKRQGLPWIKWLLLSLLY